MKSDIRQVNRLYCEFEVVHKSVVPPEQIAGLNKEPQLKVSPYFNQSTTDNESAEAGEDGFSDQDSWDEIFNGKTLANSTAKNFDSPTVESVSEEIASGDNFSGSNNDGLNTAIIDLTTAEEPKDGFSDDEEFDEDYSHVFQSKRKLVSPEKSILHNPSEIGNRSSTHILDDGLNNSDESAKRSHEKLMKLENLSENDTRSENSMTSDRSGNLFGDTDGFSSSSDEVTVKNSVNDVIEIIDSPERPSARDLIKKQKKMQDFFRKK